MQLGKPTFESSHLDFPSKKSGFCKRGLANGVSPFFRKPEENGKNERKQKKGNRKKQPKEKMERKKKEENGKKNRRKRKKTEKIGSDTVPATPLAKSRKKREYQNP